jgi:hypothetical protein
VGRLGRRQRSTVDLTLIGIGPGAVPDPKRTQIAFLPAE